MQTIISADSHVIESPDVFTGLVEQFGDEAPRVMTVGDQVDAIVIPARGMRGIGVGRLGLAGLRVREDGNFERRHGHKPEATDLQDPKIQEVLALGYKGLQPGLRDGAMRGAEQDIDGVAMEFLYPGFFGMFSLKNTQLQVALQRNYNDWIFDYAAAAGGRLHGLAAIPLQDPVAAAAELERIIGKGFKGACIPCTAPAQYPYHDPAYDRIWSIAQEADLPLSMHVGTNAYAPRELRPPKQLQDPLSGYAGAAASVQRTLSDLICRGVAERFPSLKFVVAEFNAGWIAHWLYRLDQGVSRERRFGRLLELKHKPSEIWRRQFYATIEDDAAALLTRSLIGVDNLMWGSDYPHTDSTFPCSLAVLDELMTDLPAEDRRKITHDNAVNVYHL